MSGYGVQTEGGTAQLSTALTDDGDVVATGTEDAFGTPQAVDWGDEPDLSEQQAALEAEYHAGSYAPTDEYGYEPDYDLVGGAIDEAIAAEVDSYRDLATPDYSGVGRFSDPAAPEGAAEYVGESATPDERIVNSVLRPEDQEAAVAALEERPGIALALDAMRPAIEEIEEQYGAAIALQPEILNAVYEFVGGDAAYGDAAADEAEIEGMFRHAAGTDAFT